jgi:flagellar biosynthesis anti-sigma factor FlgM
MKISRSQHVQPVEPVKARPERAQTGSEAPPKDTVTLSSSAGFVETAREAAASGPTFRPEVVADVKAALADGSFESSLDMDAAMDSLLADL